MTTPYYIPTPDELFEMSFIELDTQFECGNVVYSFTEQTWEIFIPNENDVWCAIEIFPSSKSDIETLIRIFTK